MPSINSRIVGIVRIDDGVVVDWLDSSPSSPTTPTATRQTTFPTQEAASEAAVFARLPRLREELRNLFDRETSRLDAS